MIGPSSNPEFNALDYSIWSILQAKAHKTVESLKRNCAARLFFEIFQASSVAL
jgi:hypothetical protein